MEAPPFHPGSPWYQFHPDSRGFLEHKLQKNEHIRRDDLVRVYKANKGMAWDGRLHAMLGAVLDGTFQEKSGRKPKYDFAMLSVINAFVDLEAEDIRARRASAGYAHERGDLSVMEEAYENTARAWKLAAARAWQISFAPTNCAEITGCRVP